MLGLFLVSSLVEPCFALLLTLSAAIVLFPEIALHEYGLCLSS